jgi:serine/threonine-protein kinase
MDERHVDRRTFLGRLRASGVVDEDRLRRLLADLPATDRGRALARDLVDRGALTRFQAERILANRTTGFVLGQYVIQDLIGRGGMSRVYKAEHRTMGRVVALKILRKRVLKSGKAEDFFLREIKAVGQLIHPNVVAAFDADTREGRTFLVLEYVDGPNLGQLVETGGPLPVPLACEYVRQAALGLQHAHDQGVVHRDVKPSNLLVQRPAAGEEGPGVVKVSDFGLARLRGSGTVLVGKNVVLGTPDFLSPEQGRDLHSADIRSDLYSLGCTLFFLLTGEVPFPGGRAMDKLWRHATEAPRPVGAVRPDVPAAVAAAVARLMAKVPEDRFQTPAELAAALAPYAAGGDLAWAPLSRPPAAEEDLATPSGGTGEGEAALPSSGEVATSEEIVPPGRASPLATTLTYIVRWPGRGGAAGRRLGWPELVAVGLAGVGLLVLLLVLIFGR